jgi:hypothetical protein
MSRANFNVVLAGAPPGDRDAGDPPSPLLLYPSPCTAPAAVVIAVAAPNVLSPGLGDCLDMLAPMSDGYEAHGANFQHLAPAAALTLPTPPPLALAEVDPPPPWLATGASAGGGTWPEPGVVHVIMHASIERMRTTMWDLEEAAFPDLLQKRTPAIVCFCWSGVVFSPPTAACWGVAGVSDLRRLNKSYSCLYVVPATKVEEFIAEAQRISGCNLHQCVHDYPAPKRFQINNIQSRIEVRCQFQRPSRADPELQKRPQTVRGSECPYAVRAVFLFCSASSGADSLHL